MQGNKNVQKTKKTKFKKKTKYAHKRSDGEDVQRAGKRWERVFKREIGEREVEEEGQWG